MRTDALDVAMERYAHGDDRAFPAVYAGLHGRLRAFLLRLAGRGGVADDLLQETFIRLHRARGSFSPGAAVAPWAYAIARNAWLDHLRSAKVRAGVQGASSDEQDGASVATGPEGDPEQVAMGREAAALVERVLASLPPAQREAFVLLRYEGLTVQDAAEVVGTTPTALKLRAFRAYEALRRALAVDRVEGDRHGA